MFFSERFTWLYVVALLIFYCISYLLFIFNLETYLLLSVLITVRCPSVLCTYLVPSFLPSLCFALNFFDFFV